MSARTAERRGVGIPFAPRLGSQTPHQGKTPGVHLHCPPRLAGGLGGGLAVGTHPPIGTGGAPSQGGNSSPVNFSLDEFLKQVNLIVFVNLHIDFNRLIQLKTRQCAFLSRRVICAPSRCWRQALGLHR